jgi:hypothetical protein
MTTTAQAWIGSEEAATDRRCSWARLSTDRRYRYWLGRRWSDRPAATFVMLNPSTADDVRDDPTIRRCHRFAASWGYGALHVVNLYALRATNPRELWTVADPVGPQADHWLRVAARYARTHDAPLVAAWGVHARTDRVNQVLGGIEGMDRLLALGTTTSGAPRHPLYLPKTAQLAPWQCPGRHMRPGTDSQPARHQIPPHFGRTHEH